MKRKVGIFVFDDAEVLDFAGPFEVFSVASEIHNHTLFEVFLCSEDGGAITAVNGLSVNPHYAINDAPLPDILIIAGGSGSRALLDNEVVKDYVIQTYPRLELLLTICSGARVPAVLGMLDGQPFCTHHQVYAHILELAPSAMPCYDKRFIGFDNIFTSGGISAGIDLSFHIVEKLYGSEVADNTAKYMEYIRHDKTY